MEAIAGWGGSPTGAEPVSMTFTNNYFFNIIFNRQLYYNVFSREKKMLAYRDYLLQNTLL